MSDARADGKSPGSIARSPRLPTANVKRAEAGSRRNSGSMARLVMEWESLPSYKSRAGATENRRGMPLRHAEWKGMRPWSRW